MDFSVLTEYFTLVVVVACLVAGYIIKTSFDKLPNKYIPTILAVLGAILNSIVCGISVDTIVYGALMGLASTGMHQAFTRFIEKSES
jgi:prepilin signal peptidase PulO-like enzyme (type II secretory pathway)